MQAVALTLAGVDPSGGAGVYADIKTFHVHQVFGSAIATLSTVQDTSGVEQVQAGNAGEIRAQFEALVADLPIAAAKIGALPNSEIAKLVAGLMEETSFPWIVDPIESPTYGVAFASSACRNMMREEIVPRAALITPNAKEATALGDVPPIKEQGDLDACFDALKALGAKDVLITSVSVAQGSYADWLELEGKRIAFEHPRLKIAEVHGTGCALSAAITARLARGEEMKNAVKGAIDWMQLEIADSIALGRGMRVLKHQASEV